MTAFSIRRTRRSCPIPDPNDRPRPFFARIFEKQAIALEPTLRPLRVRLAAGLAGRVVEVGAGTGASFEHYPTTVDTVIAFEPEPHLRALAVTAAARATVPVGVRSGCAERLPAADGEFDAALVSLTLCSVDDPGLAARELARVLRPGGELRFHEHVRSASRPVALLQRFGDLIWPRVGGGCHLARPTEETLTAAGFVIEHVERFRLSTGPLDPPKPHVLGIARRA